MHHWVCINYQTSNRDYLRKRCDGFQGGVGYFPFLILLIVKRGAIKAIFNSFHYVPDIKIKNIRQPAACYNPLFRGSLPGLWSQHPEHCTCFQLVQALWALTFVGRREPPPSDDGLLLADRMLGTGQPRPARWRRSSPGPQGRPSTPPWEKP